MKSLFKEFIKLLYSIVYVFKRSNMFAKKTSFYLTNIKIDDGNQATFEQAEINKTHIVLSGKGNSIQVSKALISHSSISITGDNNKLIIDPDAMLRGGTVHIRGNNCSIIIGRGTTFGGVRIVNAGKNNNIEIGENCLFADFIEIWGSDTHSIYDVDGNFINPERPVLIGNNVWVGSYVKILKGTTIGTGAVIGMNSVVTKDILPKTLNVGNPVRCIKENISWSLKYENE